MDEYELSRRKILAGMAAVGASGATLGAGSGALLTDAELIAGTTLSAGGLDLVVSGDGWTSDGTTAQLSFDLGEEAGSETITVSLPTESNPAYVWVGSICPENGDDDLAEAIQIDLSYPDGDSITGWMSLADFQDRLAEGIVLDGDEDASTEPGEQTCVETGEDLELTLSWELNTEDLHPQERGYQEIDFTMTFAGYQCRDTDGTANPFAGQDCEEPGCPCCANVGKLEADDVGGLEENTTYSFTEGSSEYEIQIVDLAPDGEEPSGVEFTVVGVGDTPDPELCAVFIKGGTETLEFDQSLLTGAPNSTGELLWAPINPKNGERYAISHIVVGICTEQTDDGCPSEEFVVGEPTPADEDDTGPEGDT